MKFQYLGTGAGEGLPALFCECDVCMEAKRRGGRNIRTRSQAIINGDLLLDFPADTYMHYLSGSFNMARVKNCLIIHAHYDHLYAADFWTRAPALPTARRISP